MKNIVVVISGNGSNLQAIIDQCAAGKIDGQVVAVISNNADAYGLVRAEQADISTVVLDHKAYSDRDEYDHVLAATIDIFQADLVVLAGFMRILSTGFVEHFAGRLLNIHPSLLPKYKGLHTHQRAIDANDEEHGCSVHFVTAELDGGPVILQARVPVFDEDTADTLAERVQEQERQIYPLVCNWFCTGRLKMENDHAYLDNQLIGPQGYAAD